MKSIAWYLSVFFIIISNGNLKFNFGKMGSMFIYNFRKSNLEENQVECKSHHKWIRNFLKWIRRIILMSREHYIFNHDMKKIHLPIIIIINYKFNFIFHYDSKSKQLLYSLNAKLVIYYFKINLLLYLKA